MVTVVLDNLAAGLSADEVLASHPAVTEEHLRGASGCAAASSAYR